MDEQTKELHTLIQARHSWNKILPHLSFLEHICQGDVMRSSLVGHHQIFTTARMGTCAIQKYPKCCRENPLTLQPMYMFWDWTLQSPNRWASFSCCQQRRTLGVPWHILEEGCHFVHVYVRPGCLALSVSVISAVCCSSFPLSGSKRCFAELSFFNSSW